MSPNANLRCGATGVLIRIRVFTLLIREHTDTAAEGRSQTLSLIYDLSLNRHSYPQVEEWGGPLRCHRLEQEGYRRCAGGPPSKNVKLLQLTHSSGDVHRQASSHSRHS